MTIKLEAFKNRIVFNIMRLIYQSKVCDDADYIMFMLLKAIID